jgi:DNA mismatch repair ATPase MutS
MLTYLQNRLSTANAENHKLRKKSFRFSILRLLIVVLFLLLILFNQSTSTWLYATFSFLFGIFVLLFWMHQKIKFQIKISNRLLANLENEILFCENKKQHLAKGIEFKEPGHNYSEDIDIFGEFSLFEHINRGQTYGGKELLSNWFKSGVNNSKNLYDKQESIKELSLKKEFLEMLYAYTSLNPDTKEKVSYLKEWLTQNKKQRKTIYNIWVWITIVAFWISFLTYIVFDNIIAEKLSGIVFLINLGITFIYLLKKQKTQIHLEHIGKILPNYSYAIALIENESFSAKMNHEMWQKIKGNNASRELKKLQLIKEKIDSKSNGLVVILFNGLALYHVRAIQKLEKWAQEQSQNIEEWIQVIAYFEATGSIANFYNHNKEFCFPTLSPNKELKAESMGHPLLKKENMVANSIHIQPNQIVLLTGSNMSGKSTFLRTLAINLVLANCGSPVCATSFQYYAFSPFISLKIEDSLSKEESYFYAEILRLKKMVNLLQNGEPLFIFLDEILRGTNSEDKQKGTVGLIEKLIQQNATGIIATHDLEVCKLEEKYPTQIVNLCFEVEIINNVPVFDYTLRKGICKNKSATTLMQNAGII